jgi:hypothetical protein
MSEKLFAPGDRDYIEKLNTLHEQVVAIGGGGGELLPKISEDPTNRAKAGSDGGVYVSDDLSPDPLAYYILSRS